ncbi:MAG: type II toxin-antitoxin system antitoxin SocA domain-containing protein [Terracidiphilus sp.]
MTAREVARYFVSLVDEDAGDSISNLKLQKLLYYAQGFHLAFFDRPLFDEAVRAWAHGPVVPQIYHEYKEFGANSIPVAQVNLEDYPKETREFLDEVYSVYGQFSATKLRDLTHCEPPWANTPQSVTISHESMKEFFKTLVVQDDDPQAQAQ